MNSAISQQTPDRNTRKLVIYGVGAVIVVFVLLQFVRFFVPEFVLDNPPVAYTVTWDSPETQALWDTACADCHSNETVYPWYSYVAPVGWLIAHDTHEGRQRMNVSTGREVEVHEMVEQVDEGEMPPSIYTTMHPDATLTDSQRSALINGLRASTFRVPASSADTNSVTNTTSDTTRTEGDHDDDGD